MKKIIRELNSFCKGVILFLRPGAVLYFLSYPLLFFSNLLLLTRWVSKQKRKGMLDDFYKPFRNFSHRFKLYEYVLEQNNLAGEDLNYLEFGVYTGNSFRWWLSHNNNPSSSFYGFDTFEGLPEGWGTYAAGDMNAAIPALNDSRARFIKGLFQDTLFDFIRKHNLENKRMVIHLDADLFSSTLFALTTLAPYLKKGDILIFDEFNVPNHEFYAYKIFTESFYIKSELIAAVNNYYQCAFKITGR